VHEAHHGSTGAPNIARYIGTSGAIKRDQMDILFSIFARGAYIVFRPTFNFDDKIGLVVGDPAGI